MIHIGINEQKPIGTGMEIKIRNFFHASATAKKKVNHILSLEDDQGVKITDNP